MHRPGEAGTRTCSVPPQSDRACSLWDSSHSLSEVFQQVQDSPKGLLWISCSKSALPIPGVCSFRTQTGVYFIGGWRQWGRGWAAAEVHDSFQLHLLCMKLHETVSATVHDSKLIGSNCGQTWDDEVSCQRWVRNQFICAHFNGKQSWTLPKRHFDTLIPSSFATSQQKITWPRQNVLLRKADVALGLKIRSDRAHQKRLKLGPGGSSGYNSADQTRTCLLGLGECSQSIPAPLSPASRIRCVEMETWS